MEKDVDCKHANNLNPASEFENGLAQRVLIRLT